MVIYLLRQEQRFRHHLQLFLSAQYRSPFLPQPPGRMMRRRGQELEDLYRWHLDCDEFQIRLALLPSWPRPRAFLCHRCQPPGSSARPNYCCLSPMLIKRKLFLKSVQFLSLNICTIWSYTECVFSDIPSACYHGQLAHYQERLSRNPVFVLSCTVWVTVCRCTKIGPKFTCESIHAIAYRGKYIVPKKSLS